MQLAIQQEILRHEDSRYDHRLHGVLLVSKGMSCYQAGEFFGHDSTTVQRWVNDFNANGYSGLYDKERPGRPTWLPPSQWDKLSKDLRKHPKEFGYIQNLWYGKLPAHHLNSHYGVEVGVRQCQRIFHKFVFRLRRPRPVFNTETFFEFLKMLSKHGGKRKPLTVVLDNARYHHAILLKNWLYKKRKRIILLFLPPYSPDLNPIERIWKLTRRNRTHNQYFSTLDYLVHNVKEQLTIWGVPNGILRKLCCII